MHRGKGRDDLSMDLDYSKLGVENLSMFDYLYPLIGAYAYRRTIINFLGRDKNIKNQLKF